MPIMYDTTESGEAQAKALQQGRKREMPAWLSRYGEALAVLICGILTGVAWGLEQAGSPWAALFFIGAYAIGGFAKAREGLETLIRERDLDVNFLMIVAAIGAACIGYWMEGAVLIFIFALSGALESFTMDKSRREISALMELKPETAVLLRDGAEVTVPIERLVPGDIVVVKPGERIPADGVVREGHSSVNQSTITGESIPDDKASGDEVFAGTLNGQGALLVEVTKPAESTLFARIIRLVQEAESEKPASQQFMERFEKIYARVVVLATLLLIAAPPLLFGWTWTEALYKSMVFLVVASPCALVASIMPAVLSAISVSARRGVLFKGGVHLENMAHTKVVAFDKTGTLTTGQPEVSDVVPLRGFDAREVLRVAASVETLSEHPLARAIVRKAAEEGITPTRPSSFESRTGWGVQAELDGKLWKIGKPTYMDSTNLTPELRDIIDRLQQEGKTVTIIHDDEGAAGVIALRDRIRPEAAQAIRRLKEIGVRTAMLTGDQERTAQAIAREAGIDIVYAGLLPQEKVEIVKKLKETYGSVAMVGDGVNDAPALAAASVGIAMGGAGSDAALETADLVLMRDDLRKIPGAIALGKRTSRVIIQNIVFALAVIVMLIAANFGVGIPLPIGVVGHEGSTILVILNGLRLLRQPT
jgi:Cd2+/Zn2+-exporting ATPase